MRIPPPRPRVLVVGAGTMGRAIARLLVGAGHEVLLTDRDEDLLGAASEDVGALGHGSSFRTMVDWGAEAASVDLVIESVSESVEVKAEILGELSAALSPACVIASTASSFTPSELAEHTTAAERLLCLHFFNPPDVVRLVEIQGHPGTAPELVQWALHWVESLGSHPVLIGQERRGFVANRLQAALLVEAVALVTDGVVSAEELDYIVTCSIGPRWAAVGPLSVADLGGLDIFNALIRRIGPTLATSDVAVQHIQSLVDHGHTGTKTGQGFRRHPDAGSGARGLIKRWARLAEE